MKALALVLILEGILPFASPQRWREVFIQLIQMADHQIRFIGLSSMIVGLLLFIWLS